MYMHTVDDTPFNLLKAVLCIETMWPTTVFLHIVKTNTSFISIDNENMTYFKFDDLGSQSISL